MRANNNRADVLVLPLLEQKDSAPPGSFDWPLANEAEGFLRHSVETFLNGNSFGRQLAERMLHETGTDFFEWIDHLTLPLHQEAALRRVGFVPDEKVETPRGEIAYRHPRATLPSVLLGRADTGGPGVVALRPEYVADFLARHNLSAEPEGEPFSRYRRVVVCQERDTRLEAVERSADCITALHRGARLDDERSVALVQRQRALGVALHHH